MKEMIFDIENADNGILWKEVVNKYKVICYEGFKKCKTLFYENEKEAIYAGNMWICGDCMNRSYNVVAI